MIVKRREVRVGTQHLQVAKSALDRQAEQLAPDFGAEARDHALAMAFVARLDARTPLPIANDPAFHHGLFQLALEEPWIETGEDRQLLTFDGLEALGLADPVLCDVPKRLFADFLAGATARLLPRHLSSTVRPPIPSLASQLALDFLTA